MRSFMPLFLGKELKKMDQGRKQTQIEASNKMMGTFLIAMAVFILITYTFNLVDSKSKWIKKIEQQFVAKSR
ncbi:hypothetical protein GCM10022246_36670 [Pedobacter ginsengiterrae]|uniref:Uncharacterized protein n=2 Tax=Sphingobacteriaceae TaxID=84566 RepID=A0ABP7QEP2_9SPHI